MTIEFERRGAIHVNCPLGGTLFAVFIDGEYEGDLYLKGTGSECTSFEVILNRCHSRYCCLESTTEEACLRDAAYDIVHDGDIGYC